MPAEPSSPIAPEIGHLVELTESLADERAGLVAVLARVADPRKRRGVRHRLSAVVGLAVCAVLAGARSYVAIAEWAADADEATLGFTPSDGHLDRGPSGSAERMSACRDRPRRGRATLRPIGVKRPTW